MLPCSLAGKLLIVYSEPTLTIDRNADVPRALVRDMYTKSWSAFDRLVAIVPPGGSIGCACYVIHPRLQT